MHLKGICTLRGQGPKNEAITGKHHWTGEGLGTKVILCPFHTMLVTA